MIAFSCCGCDPESDQYAEAVKTQCSCWSAPPPCRYCTNDVCAMCGDDSFIIEIVPDLLVAERDQQEDYDRAMSIL